MAEMVLAYGCIDLYVLHGVNEPNVVLIIDTPTQETQQESQQEAQQHMKKITPKRSTFQSVTPQLSPKLAAHKPHLVIKMM